MTEWMPEIENGCPPPESVLDEASRLVQGARRDGYGHPLKNHTATAEMFGAYLQRKYGIDLPLNADDVCWFNIFQKASRDANSPDRDNLVDVAGYVHNIELIRRGRILTDPS